MPDSGPEAQNGASSGTTPPAVAEKTLPGAADLHVEKPVAPPTRQVQRNPILAELVQGEDDLPGLVGYGLYKLNKRDWLAAFFKTHGREPTEGEVESYVLGERTQRRIATYRHLGEDLVRRKSELVEKIATATATATAASSPLERVSALKATSLKSALAPMGQTPGGASPPSAKAALIFWIAVLIVLAATGYYYVNYSSLFLGR